MPSTPIKWGEGGRSGPGKYVDWVNENGDLTRVLHHWHEYGGDVAYDTKSHIAVFRCKTCGEEYNVDTSG